MSVSFYYISVVCVCVCECIYFTAVCICYLTSELMNMAPSPEHDNEPKAPDKSDNKTSEGVELRTGGDFLEDHVSSTRTVDLQVSHIQYIYL